MNKFERGFLGRDDFAFEFQHSCERGVLRGNGDNAGIGNENKRIIKG